MVLGSKASLVSVAVGVAFAALACDRPDLAAGRDEAALAKADERYTDGALAFGQYCALCHAADATGYAADHAPSLVSATFLESASDDFLARGIREGRPGTAMAAYAKARGGPLDEDELTSIIAFLRDRGPLPLSVAPRAAAVVGDVANGEAVYAASCRRCHGTRADRGDAVHLANATFLSAASDAFLRHAVVHGRPPTPPILGDARERPPTMPAFEGVLSEGQIDDVVAYVRSLATPPEVPRRAPPGPPPLGKVVINPGGGPADLTLRADRFAAIDEVKLALDANKRIVIIDARAASDWYNMHIPGSVSVPYYLLARLDTMPRDGTWIVAYCACPHHASGAVVDELRKRGYPHTAVLDEGIFAWQKRGYPIDRTPLPDDPGAGTPPAAAAPKRLLPPRRP